MDVKIIFSLLRHALTILGPLLATKGVDIDQVGTVVNELEVVVGSAMTILGVSLSIYNSVKAK